MNVLRWLRSRRITRRDAAHLLDATHPLDEHPGLADLLAAATAPARPDELAGERAAVAGFRREYRPAEPDAPLEPGTAPESATAPRRPGSQRASEQRTSAHRSAARRPRRRGVAVATLAAVVALVGGTAYAAGAGRLPDPVQRQLHEALAGVGVPPPEPRGTPTPAPGSASVPVPSGASPSDAHLLGLCRAWQTARATPGAPQLRPDEKRVLADAAGGPNRIEVFCAALVATASGTATPATPAPVTTATGKPGNPNPGGPPATPPGQGKTGNNGNGPPG